MKRFYLYGIGLLILAAFGVTGIVLAAGKDGLRQVRDATRRYRSVQAAEKVGYALLPGLDHCFDNPGVGAMGYHYINPALLDTRLDPLQPETMVYSRVGGRLKLGAVEYIVPLAAWEAEGNRHPPEVLGQHLHLNEALGVYVLHAWIWNGNPAGVFEDWNPRVSCP